jgi:tRNA (guanine37-N1)-methyltransferase
MKVDLITLFPKMLDGFLSESMMGRAIQKGLLEVIVHDLRTWAKDPHRTVDDRPFGGGAGMVLKPEPLFAAVEALRGPNTKVIYLCPDGQLLDTAYARSLSTQSHLLCISGHYEGIDQRVRDHLVDMEISIGNYVLTNGTLPAAVLLDAVVRHIPGCLGSPDSLTQDSFSDRLLSFPQYTRPECFRHWNVPPILLSGNHAEIQAWRRQEKISKTRHRRPELQSIP